MPQIEICVDAVGPRQLREFCDRLLPCCRLVVIRVGVAVGPADQRGGESGGSPGSVGVDAGVTATSADASVRCQTGLPEAVLRGARERCATATGRGAWPVCPDGGGRSPECNRLGVSRIRHRCGYIPCLASPEGAGYSTERQVHTTSRHFEPGVDRFPGTGATRSASLRPVPTVLRSTTSTNRGRGTEIPALTSAFAFRKSGRLTTLLNKHHTLANLRCISTPIMTRYVVKNRDRCS